MGKKPHNKPFSVFYVLDLERWPIQKNIEPLVIITKNISFLLFDLFDLCYTLGLGLQLLKLLKQSLLDLDEGPRLSFLRSGLVFHVPHEGPIPEYTDPGGYRWPPTFSNWLKTIFWQFCNILFLVVFNFQGHFEGLNEVISISGFSMLAKSIIETPK